MTEILGTKAEIRLTWKQKPELRTAMVRFMMKKRGHAGVKALASLVKLSYQEIYEIGGIEGCLNRRNCQRRQRRKRQQNKLREYNLEVIYTREPVVIGGGKRGKGGGIQDVGRRTLIQAKNGQ